ncbi:MAG: hypothetical protein NVSMB46_08250 [Candidatus Saccharimonadales bacterium]
MSAILYNVVGVIGAILILFGFYRTSIGRWTSKNFWYELDNLLGAVLLIIYQMHFRAYISVIVNTIWAIVAFRGITSFAERYNKQSKKRGKKRVSHK